MKPIPRPPSREVDTLTDGEVEALVRAVGRGRSAVRNAAIVAVLWRSGLRIAELLALRPSDVDHTHATIRVRRGKGGKPRTVPIDFGALAVLERWETAREAEGVPRRAPLFCSISHPEPGRPLAATYVRRLLLRLGERGKLDKRVHPHMFRHTYAASLAREGVPMPLIQRLLGHARLATTSTYLARVGTAAELLAAVQSRPRTFLEPDDLDVARGRSIAGAIRRGAM